MSQGTHIGGLVAVGFDPTGAYLLTVTHSSRGVFCMKTWEKVARNYELAYPEDGYAIGIGPIEGMRIPVRELNSDQVAHITSPNGRLHLRCESSSI